MLPTLFLQLPGHDFFYFHMKMEDCLGLSIWFVSQCLRKANTVPSWSVSIPSGRPSPEQFLWIGGQLDWLVQGHTDSIKETPQWVLLLYNTFMGLPTLSGMLLAPSSCQRLWRAHTNNLLSLLKENCDRLRFEDCHRQYLSAKTNSKQYIDKLPSPVKALSMHRVWFLPNMVPSPWQRRPVVDQFQ